MHLDDGGREALRGLFNLAKAGKPAAAAPPLVEMPVEVPVAAPAVVRTVSITGGSRAAQLESLRQQAGNWPPALALKSLRETLVFGAGNPESKLMLIGDAPGYQEEREQQPFAGPAGEKLDAILKAMGLSRSEVYISSIVKFRPFMPRQTTNNRNPTPEEFAVWLPFVRAEVQIIQPACIIALGGTAAEGLLGRSGTVPELRGAWHAFEGCPVRVSFHPSHLLSTTGLNEKKRQFWEDMLAAMDKLGLPISEKQRGFFLTKT